MPRIIFKCPYIKPGTENVAVHLGNYVRYVAARDGAEMISPDTADYPATKRQQAMVGQILRDFPLSREMFEYEDYLISPTRSRASAFITSAIEENCGKIAKLENYVGYIAQRPMRSGLAVTGCSMAPKSRCRCPESRRRWRAIPAMCGCPLSPCAGRTPPGLAMTVRNSVG